MLDWIFYIPPIGLVLGGILITVSVLVFSGFKQNVKNSKLCPECQMRIRISATKCGHCLTALKK
jgi:ribosomal protein L40E